MRRLAVMNTFFFTYNDHALRSDKNSRTRVINFILSDGRVSLKIGVVDNGTGLRSIKTCKALDLILKCTNNMSHPAIYERLPGTRQYNSKGCHHLIQDRAKFNMSQEVGLDPAAEPDTEWLGRS
jgi:hypothetical protein